MVSAADRGLQLEEDVAPRAFPFAHQKSLHAPLCPADRNILLRTRRFQILVSERIVGRGFLHWQLFTLLDGGLLAWDLPSVLVMVGLRVAVNLLLDVLPGDQQLLISSLWKIESIGVLEMIHPISIYVVT